MKSTDVAAAVVVVGKPAAAVCYALGQLLPVFKNLANSQPWYVRLPLKTVIAALEDYQAETCL